MGPEMTEKELIKALRKYGDHKSGCGITKVINNPRAETNDDGHRIYPLCSCGWGKIIKELTGR